MMRGLYGREHLEVVDADGWYHTGDKCRIVDGVIHFVSRFTEMIKTSGSNVAPLEVETVLLRMPGVREPVVFGVPDADRGERVVAVVVPAAAVALDEEAVKDWVRANLSNYKVPRDVLVVDEEKVPRLHSGKPDKRLLAQLVTTRSAPSGSATLP